MRLLLVSFVFISAAASASDIYKCDGGLYTDKPAAHENCVNTRTKVPFAKETENAPSPASGQGGAPTQGRLWYEGGTLHKARSAEWRRAAEWNRLATAGDFTAKIFEGRVSSMSKLKDDAEELSSCISEAVRDVSIDQEIAGIAAACGVLMGWDRR